MSSAEVERVLAEDRELLAGAVAQAGQCVTSGTEQIGRMRSQNEQLRQLDRELDAIEADSLRSKKALCLVSPTDAQTV